MKFKDPAGVWDVSLPWSDWPISEYEPKTIPDHSNNTARPIMASTRYFDLRALILVIDLICNNTNRIEGLHRNPKRADFDYKTSFCREGVPELKVKKISEFHKQFDLLRLLKLQNQQHRPETNNF